MKKIIGIILTLALMFSAVSAFAAGDNIVDVKFNGEIMEFDVPARAENGRTLVPFRAIFEALGCNVFYYESAGEHHVYAKKADDTLSLVIGDNKMFFNEEEIALDVPAKAENNRTLVPLRALSEAFGADVDWDGETNAAIVNTKQGDYKIESKSVYSEILNEDGSVLVNLAATYPQIDNPDNDEFITLINELNYEFAGGMLIADEDVRNKAEEVAKENKDRTKPLEVSASYNIDTNKNGFLSITYYTFSSLDGGKKRMESIVYDISEKKQLGIEDIIIGDDLKTEIQQSVFDAFVGYYESEYGEDFNAATAEKLGNELDNVRFYLTDNSLVLYFNPGQVYDNQKPDTVEIPYSESFFKIKLEEKSEAKVVAPLPSTIDLSRPTDATLSVSLKEGDAYVDDTGKMQMKVMVYDYDLYDMVDIATLEEGDSIIRNGETVLVESIVRGQNGFVYINGGLDSEKGFELRTEDNTVYYENGYNDAKSFYEVGEAVIRVSTEFIYTDKSDLDSEPKVFYPGDFLTDDAGIDYHFVPHNTTIVVNDGFITEMTRTYMP